MIDQIVTAVASLISYLSAHGIDKIIGRYMAALQIAFEKAASNRAKQEYRNSLTGITDSLAQKYADWARWRDEHRSSLPGSPASDSQNPR